MLRHHHARRRVTALLTALTLGLGATACGNDTDDGAEPSAERTAANGAVFNDADVDFATAMIPHHAQAIEMVTLTDARTLDPAVKQLADTIRDAQAPEVETMVDWLTAWGEEIPPTSLDHSNAGHDMDDMDDMGDDMGDDTGGMADDVPGMMTAEDMQALATASDAEFQDLWLRMMVEHHKGAIAMAKRERADGRFPDAVSLAESIETSQRAEIAQLEALIGS